MTSLSHNYFKLVFFIYIKLLDEMIYKSLIMITVYISIMKNFNGINSYFLVKEYYVG